MPFRPIEPDAGGATSNFRAIDAGGGDAAAPAPAPTPAPAAAPAPAKPAAATSSPSGKTDDYGVYTGAIMDTLGLTNRKGARTVADALLRPRGALEIGAREAALSPTWLLGPGGRIAAQAGVGALERLTSKDHPSSWSEIGLGAALDAAAAGVVEGTLGAAGKVVGRVAKPYVKSLADTALARAGVDKANAASLAAWRKSVDAANAAYAKAVAAPGEALNFLRSRLPKTGKYLDVPSISPNKLSVDEAVDGLAKLEGNAYQQARDEIMREFNRLDIPGKGVRVPAGTQFGRRTRDIPDSSRPIPPRSLPYPEAQGNIVQRGAKGISDALASGPVRGAADTLGTVPVDEQTGAPIPGLAVMKVMEKGRGLWDLIKHAVPSVIKAGAH